MDDLLKEDKSHNISSSTAAILALTIASVTMLRRGNYRVVLKAYAQCGGYGVNLYKIHAEGTRPQRVFAIDYHPFWDSRTQESAWRLHYHRGANASQMRKHRPYEGGW